MYNFQINIDVHSSDLAPVQTIKVGSAFGT